MPLEESEAYFDIQISSQVKRTYVYLDKAHNKSPTTKISSRCNEAQIVKFLLDFAHAKIDIVEAISARDVKFGARIARLRAVLKRAEARMTPTVRRAISKAEHEIGELRRAEIKHFIRLVLRQLKSPVA